MKKIPLNHGKSFLMALEKVCTSISSGWWREYAWEHYDEAVSLFDSTPKYSNYLELFNDSVVLDRVVKISV